MIFDTRLRFHLIFSVKPKSRPLLSNWDIFFVAACKLISWISVIQLIVSDSTMGNQRGYHGNRNHYSAYIERYEGQKWRPLNFHVHIWGIAKKALIFTRGTSATNDDSRLKRSCNFDLFFCLFLAFSDFIAVFIGKVTFTLHSVV